MEIPPRGCDLEEREERRTEERERERDKENKEDGANGKTDEVQEQL